MSWLFCIAGNIKEKDIKKTSLICKNTLFSHHSEGKYFICTGPYERTCFSGEMFGFNWFACGAAIKKVDDTFKFVDKQDWEKTFNELINKDFSEFNKLNGHFITCLADERNLTIMNDDLGVREFFYSQTDDITIISTRLDFICRFTGKNNFNLSALGSRWLHDNQISDSCLIEGINRVGSKGRLTLNFEDNHSHSVKISEKKWLPENKFSNEKIEKVLTDLITFPIKNKNNLKFALSGGFDSRVILSVLMNYEQNLWSSFTFGEKLHPDSRLSKLMSTELSFKHTQFDEDIRFDEKEITQLLDYSIRNKLTSPLSEYYTKRYYENIETENSVFIDGGFGEILRRGLFNKLFYKGKKALIQRDFNKINDLLFYNRADIFINDAKLELFKSSRNSVNELIESMPEISSFGLENWLDLLSVRTKLTNYCSIEQSRIDEFSISYNPYSQKDFLNLVFQTDLNLRNNAVLMRKFIKVNCHLLEKYPLVKGDLIIPYGLSTLNQKLYLKIKKKITSSFHETYKNKFLKEYRSWIMDLTDSSIIKNDNLLDQNKIKLLLNSYYRGDETNIKEISWMLAYVTFIAGIRQL